MATVDSHDLRQNLELYLRRVAAGESLEVLEDGRPVARILPAPPAVLQRLEAAGRLRPAQGDLLDLGPPTFSAPGFSSTATLAELRAED